jgi:hypothetical protein
VQGLHVCRFVSYAYPLTDELNEKTVRAIATESRNCLLAIIPRWEISMMKSRASDATTLDVLSFINGGFFEMDGAAREL